MAEKSRGLVRAADILKPVQQSFELTPAQAKLLDAAAEIRQNPDATEAAFMARQLVQCTLPHTNPGKIEAWTRRSGDLTLILQAGWDEEKNCSMGYPYGSIPRLLLFWIVTEAIRTKARRLILGRSLAQFMREVGLDPNTGRGKRGDAKRLRDQMDRLFSCRISFKLRIQNTGGEGKRWLNMEVAPEGEYFPKRPDKVASEGEYFWWDPKRPDQLTLMENWVELGEKFYQAIIAAPVPVDMRALRALKRSPLALDLYAWSTYRTYIVSRKGQAQFIAWELLMQQLGTDYTEAKDFKKYASAALRKVQAVYPALTITRVKGGLKIHPSRPAIAPRPAT